MKKLIFILPILMIISCNNISKKQEVKVRTTEEFATLMFDELFTEIKPTDISENVFKLFGKDYAVVTAGSESYFNSMTVGYGGLGIHLGFPATWCFLNANRYTLEFIRGDQVYTMCWFDDNYKDAVLYYGSMSGRDSDKMANNPLSYVITPNGNIAYKEAKLIIECRLMEITTVSMDDFYYRGKEFINEGFLDANYNYELVFGEITNVWKKI